MTIVYRLEKGSPLSSLEIDDNFKDLDTRLKVLEEHLETSEGLGKIEVKEGQITLVGTFGTDFGTFPLPKANLKFYGKWNPQTPYQKFDIITSENTLYCCLKEHISNTWEQDNSLWQEILSIPKPPPTIPFYEKATLPREESLGKLALLLGEEDPHLIFFNGKAWQYLMKGETL